MGSMLDSPFRYTWRVAAGALAFAATLVGSRLALVYLGVTLERSPSQAPEDVAVYYLLVGSLALTLGITPTVRGIGGRFLLRSGVLALLLILGFALSTSLEAATYSSAVGTLPMIPVLIVPCIVLALVLSGLLGGRPQVADSAPWHSGRRRGEWVARGLAAFLAFPFVYFVFGILVSPIVSPFYSANVAGLRLPAPGTIVGIQSVRSILHLAAIVPILWLWRSSRRRLTVALGLAFFVFVAAYDPILANEIPATLVVVHGIEVALGSFCYAWLVVRLLAPTAGTGTASSA